MVRTINLKSIISIFLSIVFLQSQAYALNVRSIDKSIWTATEALRMQFPRGQVTQVGDKSFYIETGYKNILPNPNFEAITLAEGWNNTPGSSSFAALDSGNQREGLRGVTVTMAAGTHTEMEAIYSTPVTVGVDWTGTNVGGSLWIKNSNAGMKLCLRRMSSSNTQEQRSCVDLQADGIWHDYVTPGVTGGDSSKKYMLTVMKTGTISVGSPQTFYVDGEAFIGEAKLGHGTPPNTFTAFISDTGVISAQTPTNWLSSCTWPSAGESSCIPISNVFTSVPNCHATPSNFSIGAQYRKQDSTVSLLKVGTYNPSPFTAPYTLTCTKTGSDYVQPAVTAQNWNFTGRTYTPTITTNSGSLTNATVTASYSRSGGRLFVDGQIAFTGTSAAFTGISVSLPPGLSKASNYPIDFAGTTSWLDAGTEFGPTGTARLNGTLNVLLLTPSTVAGTNPVRIVDGNFLNNYPATWTTNDRIYFKFNLNVAEGGVDWQETWNALQLVGSVTSKNSVTNGIEAFAVSSGGSLTYGSVPGSSSSNTGSGAYTITVPAGTYNTVPVCPCSVTSAAPNNSFICQIDSSSTVTALKFYTMYASATNGVGTSSNLGFGAICFGGR